MTTIEKVLTVAEFEQLEDGRYEFWNGEAVERSMPTWVHGLLQVLFAQLLTEAGYKAAAEIDLRIDRKLLWRPDVIATKGPITDPYPTSPVEIVVEILSANDTFGRLLEKCRTYENWGFEQIYLVEPGSRVVYRWEGSLKAVDEVAGQPVASIWEALDKALAGGAAEKD